VRARQILGGASLAAASIDDVRPLRATGAANEQRAGQIRRHGARHREAAAGLIRDFFPKGTDFSTIAHAEVAKVERLLNARPRKSLGFRSPQEVFDSLAYS
jgi:hypothetical protein